MSIKVILFTAFIAFSCSQFLNELTEENSEVLLGASNSAAGTIVSCVKSKIGCQYKMGGNGPCIFDCSGLAKYCHAQAGINIERTASAQSTRGNQVSINNLQLGDLVFFDYGKGVAHVGTYIGGGQMVHAANEKKGVRQDAVTSGYWRGYFKIARRYW